MKELSLSRRERIKRKKELEGVFSSGKVYRGDFLSLRITGTRESDEKAKFAFLLAGKIKGAVNRNRTKRLMREVVRRNKQLFSPGDKVAILASPEARNKGFREFQSEFSNLIEKAGIESRS
jgi:ribonuclease P protein component